MSETFSHAIDSGTGDGVTVRPGGRGDPRRPVLFALMMTLSLVALDATVVTTAVPSIVRDLGGFSLFPWLFSVYLLTQAVTMPIYGRAADVIGRKPVLFIGITIFVAGSMLCGLAWNMESLIAFRGLQGLGAGATIPMVQTVIGDLYNVRERARVTGYTASVWGVASIVGPLVGGAFSQFVSWRWIFFINLPLALSALVLVERHLKEKIERKTHEIDYLGSALLTVGLVAVILGLLEGGSSWSWTSGRELTVLGIGLIFLIGFGMVERRAAEPILPSWVVTRRPLLTRSVTSLIVGASLLGLSSYIPTWVQGVRHGDPLVAGLTVASITIGWPIAAGLSGRIYLRIGFRSTALIGVSILLFAALLFTTLGQSTPIVVAALYAFVAGVGLGLMLAPITVSAQSLVGWERRGVVTSTNLFARTIGSAVGIAIFGSIENSSFSRSIARAPAAISDHISGANAGASALLGGGTTHLAPTTAAYLRAGLSNATHDVFVGAVALVVVGLVATWLIPKKFEQLSFDEP